MQSGQKSSALPIIAVTLVHAGTQTLNICRPSGTNPLLLGRYLHACAIIFDRPLNSFIRFAALSGGGWLFDCALLMLLAQFGLPLGIANFVSSATAALAVFLASRFLVFDSAKQPIVSRAAVYVGYQALAIFAASLLIGPASSWAGTWAEMAGFSLSAQWMSFCGKVIITPPQLVANFMVSRFLIQTFKRRISYD